MAMIMSIASPVRSNETRTEARAGPRTSWPHCHAPTRAKKALNGYSKAMANAAAPARAIQWRLSMKSGCLPRRVVVKTPEDGLGFVTLQPIDKGSRAFAIGRVFENTGVVDQRLRIIRLPANGQSHIGMFSVDVLPAQIDLFGQREIGKVEGTRLDLVGGGRVQFTALQPRLDRRLREDLFFVDGGAQDLFRQVGLLVDLCRQHHRKNNVASLRIANRVGTTKTNSRVLKDFPPVALSFARIFELRRKAALRTVGNHHLRVGYGLCALGFAGAEHCQHRSRRDGHEDIRA